MSKKAIRIVAIILAALMFIGIFAGAIMNSFAIGFDASSYAPTMGEKSKIIPVIIVAAAALTGGACFAVPKFKNKTVKEKENDNEQIGE